MPQTRDIERNSFRNNKMRHTFAASSASRPASSPAYRDTSSFTLSLAADAKKIWMVITCIASRVSFESGSILGAAGANGTITACNQK